MLSCYTCTGMIFAEPKRFYSKNKVEISNFWLSIKRSDKSNNYDYLKFEAYGPPANFVNTYLHKGDMVSVRSRPISKNYVSKKTGEKRHGVVFRAIMIEIICHKNRLLLNEFGGSDFPELNEMQFQFWG